MSFQIEWLLKYEEMLLNIRTTLEYSQLEPLGAVMCHFWTPPLCDTSVILRGAELI